MRLDSNRLVIALSATAIGLYNCGVTLSESHNASVVSLIYASIAPFAASYAPAPGQPAAPTTWMTIGLILSLLVTFGAVISALLGISRIGWARATSKRRRGGPVVIGSSEEANSIVRSVLDQERELPVHILEKGNPTAKGTLGLGYKQHLSDDRLVAQTVKHASHVIIAAENDIETARLSSEAQDLRHAQCGEAVSIFQLLRSPELATSARFTHIAQRRPVEAFHPADLTVRAITDKILHLLTTLDAHTVEVKQCGPGDEKRELDAWIHNYNRFANELEVQQIVSPQVEGLADMVVLVGDPVHVAAQIPSLRKRRAIIAVTDHILQGLVWNDAEAGTVLEVIDPQKVGLSIDAIRDSAFSVWGWAFDIAYTSLYGPPSPSQKLSHDDILKARQTSEAAARAMVENLRLHGFQLVKDGYGWEEHPSEQEITSMAEAEHNDWMLKRTWIDSNGTERRASYDYSKEPPARKPSYKPFAELDSHTQDYNHKIVKVVYPALAGMFGYGISRIS